MKITKENLRCSYCGSKAVLMNSAKIYNVSFGNVFTCENYPKCDAYVGQNKKTGEPLGVLANFTLRKLKKEAHALFDPLWKQRILTRNEAYSLIAELMSLDKDEAHIGYFNEEMCKKFIERLTIWKIQHNLSGI